MVDGDLMLAVILLRGHRMMRVILRIRTECQHQACGEWSKGECRLHSSTLTVRIIPASMWNSRWQWYAQLPKASARTR